MTKSNYYLFSTLLLIVLSFTSCSNDDNTSNYRNSYTTADLQIIHNNDSKNWILEGYYDQYNSKTLNKDNACYTDEQFSFTANDGQITVISGEENCFANASQTELTTASYTFYEENGSIFITISKNAELGEVTKSVFFSLQLVELEENLMIFASGEQNNYGKALVFKR